MTHCPDCKHCNIIEHPRFKYHTQVFCTLKNEGYDEDNKAPIACPEYVEEPKVVRAKWYILDNWHTNAYLDSHGFWQEERVRDGR